MGKKGYSSACELCSNPARMFCESDQASLCWECDERVHAANFLVAKHSRTLLCRHCHSPTAWNAAGLSLPRTHSLCQACVEQPRPNASMMTTSSSTVRETREEEEEECETDDDGEYYYTNADGDHDQEEEEEEEEGENQVVPLSTNHDI